MRFIGGLIVLLLAVLAFHWCAGEIAVQNLGRETKASVTSVSKSSASSRRTAYRANYEFVTEDMSKGNGTCPSGKGAAGGYVRIRYLRHDPSFNTPTVWWYAGFWMVAFGVAAWPFALWSARIFLFRRVRRFGEPEAEEAAEEIEGAEDKGEPDEGKSAPAPATDLGPVPFRNKWSAAVLFSLGLSAAAIACNLAWFNSREQAFARSQTSALPPPPLIDPPAPANLAVPLLRGASVGNTANGSLLGFDGDTLYFGLWRDHGNPAAPSPGLYRFTLDGTGRTLIGRPGDTEGIYRGIQVREEWVYYLAMSGICRIRKDGTKHKQLTENRVSSFAVVGDWIYYQHAVLDGAIYRMHLDGSSEKRLCREAVGALCVADDGWIYYANKTDQYRLWRMKADGSARARLTERRVGLLLVAGGSIWFTDLDKNSSLSRMDPSASAAQVVVEDRVSMINWAADRIYFIRDNGELARCKADGSQLETVASMASSVLIHEGRLYIHPEIEAKFFKQSKLDGANSRDLRF